MKKLKLFFSVLMFLFVSVGQIWATDAVYTFTSKSWAATLNGSAANWTSGKDGGGFSNNGVQVTTNATGANATSPASFSNISKIVVTYNTNKSKGAGSIAIQIGNNTATTNSVAYSGSADGTSAKFTTQFDYATPQTGNVKITANTTTNSIYVVSIAITYSAGGGGQQQPTLSSIAVSGTPETTTYEAGETFDVTGLTVTGTYSDKSQGTVTSGITWTACKTENGDYAALANVALAANETGIYVKATVSGKTSPAFHVTGLTVNAVEVPTLTFDFSTQGYENGVQYTSINADANITVTFGDGGNDGKYYDSGTAMRVYGGGHMTVAGGEGVTISKIVLEFGSSDGSNTISTNVGTYANGKWTGNAQSVTFNVGGTSGNRRFKVVKVFYVAAVVTTPTISTHPASASYAVGATPIALSVSATASENGGTLHYQWKSNTTNSTEGATNVGTDAATYTPSTASAGTTYYFCVVSDDNGSINSNIATIDVVAPLTTMQDIFSAATSTATDQIITFSNTWVVTGISTNGKNAYLTDGEKGLILFNNSASDQSPVAGLAAGNTLSGTVTRSLTLYNGAAELAGFTAEGLEKGTADAPSVQELDATGIAALSGVNTGSLIKISGQCVVENSKYYIKYGSGDNDRVQVYNTLYAFDALTANANYECTGVYVQYNTTKEIAPRSAEDLVQEKEKNQPETLWDAASKAVRMGDATTGWWSTSSDGAKSFSSSNTEVATITNAGVITLVAPGSTTLTFSTAETSNYYSGKATLTLTVKAALPIGGTEFTWDATAQVYSDKEVLSTVTEAPNPIITFAKTGTTDPQWYNNGSAVRFYKDNSITVTAPDNKLLYQIEINFVSGYVKTLTTDVEAYSVEGTVGTWSGMAKEVTFSNGDGAARLTSINVIYANGTVTELEIANINLKTTDSETALTITKNVDATIVYTGLDESVATISNNKVTPVGVGSTTVMASIAAGSNYTAASTTFTITVSAKAIPEMSFPQASYNANLGESFTAPILTKPEGVTVQYSSNNAAVSVDENTGAIMLNTEGSAVITATSVENDNYAVGTASYTLNVTDPYKDVLTAIGIGQSGYGDWSNKTFTTEVKYAGNSTTGTGDKSGKIQMRVQNPSGIVSTSTIGYLKNISATATKNGTNTLEIYAKNTAYESGADLYEGSTSGTLIGTIAAGGGEMVFEDGHAYSDNYKYIGIKAKGGAVYYDEIVIKWTPATFNKYTVIYKAGVATGDDVVVNNIEEGTTIQLQDNSYSYEGHIFVGWSDGTNVYEEGDEYTVNGNVTFTAQWAEQYTVTYNPGAAGGDAIVRTVAAGAYNLEAGNIFTYEGHAFDGWLKGETKYSAGASYTISENVAFTAQWVESQDPVTVTFVAGTDKSATMSLVKEGISLSYETSGGTFNRDDDYRCYSGKTLTIASEVGNITNIQFTLTQNTFTTETGVYENGSWSGNAASVEFATSGGQVRMTQIAVTYIPDGSTPKQPAGLSYDQTSYSIAQNEGFTAPTLNNPNNLAVTYSGNNDEVATVNTQTGAITLGEATGTVTITANAAAQGDFLAGTASYTLTVNAPIVIDDLSGTWALVTDASQLVVGKKVIIASVPVEGAATTMSTTQAANNRLGLAGATVSEGVITAQNGTAVFTIAAGTVENTIAFKSSANEYLYAASSGSNYIRSQAENDANGSWTVSFNEGVATITAQGEFTRNVMRHNPNTSGDNPLFACYASSSTTGTLITLYMLEEESPVTPDPEPETPDYTREVTANRYGTICIPQGGRMVDAILFEIAWHSVGEQKIYFDEIVDGTMVPGRPYIFWPKNTTIGVIYSEETPAATADSYNGLVGSFTEQTIADNDENYILYANNFYLVNIEGAAKVGANKAYVHMGDVRTTEQPQAPGRRRVSMGIQGEQVATDILNAELNAQPMKVIIDNQLFIIREGKKYDMTGNLVK